jgi:subtilisin-like proprotein convertase family protein
MKLIQTFSVLLLTAATSFGSLSYWNNTTSVGIPDGNPNGVQSSINVSGAAASISDVVVYLYITGGYNGDLYASLNLGGTSGTSVVLLNRIGSSSSSPFGSTTSGFGDSTTPYNNGGTYYSFALSTAGSSGLNSAGTSGSAITGTYQPAGGSLTSGAGLLSAFDNQDPNGTWTLSLANMAGGGSSETLVRWGVEITAVPEPVTASIVIFGSLLSLFAIGRWCWNRRKTASV